MSNKICPKIKAYVVVHSAERIAVSIVGFETPIVFDKNRLPLIELLTGSNSIRSIWDSLQSQNSTLRLSEIYLTLETLKKAGALENQIDTSYFSRNWLDFSIFKFKILDAFKFNIKNVYAFYIFSSFVVFLALLAIPNVYLNLEFHNFLQINNSFTYAIPLSFLIFSVMNLCKALLKSVLIALSTGIWPTMSFKFQGVMFDIQINESPILITSSSINKTYQLTKIFSYLFLGAVLSFANTTDFTRQFQIAALIMSFISLSPYHFSEFTQTMSIFFNDEEIRHILPFLKKRSLVGFSKKSDSHSDKKLIIFSSLSMLWLFLFFGFTQELVLSNYGFWYSALKSNLFADQLSSAILITICFIILFALLFSFLEALALNLLSFFQNQFKRTVQKLRTKKLAVSDNDEYLKFISTLSFFNSLSAVEVSHFLSRINFRKFKENTPIIISGDLGSEMYIIIDGEALVEKESESGFRQQLAVLGPGSIFGEIGLLEKRRRTADVTSASVITLAVISEGDFQFLIKDQSTAIAKKLIQNIALSRFFLNSSVFKDVPAETINLFTRKGVFERHKKGDQILTQGSEGQSFYLLLEGIVSVVRDSKNIAQLSQGDFFGEISLFYNVKRTADVVVLEDCLILRLDKNDFWDILSENMGLTFNLELISKNRKESTL